MEVVAVAIALALCLWVLIAIQRLRRPKDESEKVEKAERGEAFDWPRKDFPDLAAVRRRRRRNAR